MDILTKVNKIIDENKEKINEAENFKKAEAILNVFEENKDIFEENEEAENMFFEALEKYDINYAFENR